MARHAQNRPSKKDVGDEWRTPDWVFNPLNRVFDFTVDAAATYANRRCHYYWDENDDGLAQSWHGYRVFNNPPFTGGNYGAWVKKAAESAGDAEIICQVCPFNAETDGFEPVWDKADYLILPYKRIAFDYPDGEPSPGADFYSVIAVYSESKIELSDIKTLQKIGRVLDLNHGLGQDRVVRYTDNFK